MPSLFYRRFCGTAAVTALAVALPVAALALGKAAGEKIRLAPRFTAGESLRYRIETRTSTTGKATSPIADPEAASKVEQVARLIVRLDVLDVKPAADGSTSRVRMRATYEKSDATLESDSYDPNAAALQDQYEKLQGRSFQFTIEPDGKVSSVTGIDDVLANPAASSAVQSWMDGLASSAKYPQEGIAIGQKWANDRTLDNTPLAGLIFRTDATYLRNEACPTETGIDLAHPGSAVASTAAKPLSTSPDDAGASVENAVKSLSATAPAGAVAAPDQSAAAEDCAVILTQFQIFRHGSAHGDATPEGYLHNGLRTSGTWTGSGESLDMISLSSGMVIRSTQTGKQDMDFSIVSAASGSKMHYGGHVDSHSEIVLLDNGPTPPATDPAAK